MAINWPRFEAVLRAQLGKPYSYGVEVNMADPSPAAFDCSELVEWAYAQVGIKVPDGSRYQFQEGRPVQAPRMGDLGFAAHPGQPIHHVVIHLGGLEVIEARQDSRFSGVMLRPASVWAAWRDFQGWRRPLAVIEAEHGVG